MRGSIRNNFAKIPFSNSRRPANIPLHNLSPARPHDGDDETLLNDEEDDDGVALAVTATRAVDLVRTLHEVEDRAFESLDRHQLELERVDVTLAGYDSPNGRELA